MNNIEKTVDIDKLKEQGVIFAARGGGVRSCSAIGVLKALEEAKIPVRGICGESGSSIVTALYAYGYKAEDVYKLFLELTHAAPSPEPPATCRLSRPGTTCRRRPARTYPSCLLSLP